MVGLDDVCLLDLVIVEHCAQTLDADKVRVQPTASDLVATRLGIHGLAASPEHGTNEHHRTTKLGTFLQKSLTRGKLQIQLVGLKAVRIDPLARHFHAHVAEQLDEIVHIQDVGHVMDGHFLRCQQSGTENLKHFILGSLRMDVALQAMSAFYHKCCHSG